jgi:hypothetical protein
VSTDWQWADGVARFARAVRVVVLAGAGVARLARAVRVVALAGAVIAGLSACDILGPPPEFLRACADVKALVAAGTSVSQSRVDRPQDFADQLRKLSADLRTRADTIEDQPLRAAVIELADSYRTTADLTTQTRVPSADEVRRSAARVDDVCSRG